MDKEAVEYTMEYYSAIKNNAFESVLMRWMKLEPIIETEDRISEVEYRMVEINEAERKKEKKFKKLRTTSETSGTM